MKTILETVVVVIDVAGEPAGVVPETEVWVH
jgi:hypothetical protein